MKTLISILLYIWQLPQNIIGLIVRLFYKEKTRVIYRGKVIRICNGFPGGISLGDTIIVKKYPNNQSSWNTVKHEWGHSRQSLWLGPLYLLVIGIPSGLWYQYRKFSTSKNSDYCDFFTEEWADKLGNVKK